MFTSSRRVVLKTLAGALATSFLISGSSFAWSIGAPQSSSSLSRLFQGNAAIDRLQSALQALQDNAELRALRLTGDHAFVLSQKLVGHGVETTKFQHYYKGLEVLGSMSFRHLGPKGSVVQNMIAKFDLDTSPSLSPEDAAAVSRASVGERSLIAAPRLEILPTGKDSARLIYWVSIDRQGLKPGHDVLVDARTGELIADMPTELSLAPVEVYSAQGLGVSLDPNTTDSSSVDQSVLQGCQVIDETDGSPLIINPEACDQVVTDGVASQSADDSAKRAAANAEAVLEYYMNVHGRNSYDDQGSKVVNVVHVGVKFANAHWDTRDNHMAYGDGDGVRLGDMTIALDVAGHEQTHGVVEATSQLLNYGPSGALNEASADYFGKLIANDGDWAIGRKVMLDPDAKGLRNLQDPHQITITIRGANGRAVTKPYPASLSEAFAAHGSCGPNNDMCFVHINSTIWSHGLYLVQQAIGREKAEKLYYLTMTQYLTQTSDFHGARDAELQACAQLYDSNTCDQVQQALAQVGL